MANLLDLNLSDIVAKNYKTAQVFEKYSLDYCCKGRRTLESVCEEKSLDRDRLVSELEHIIKNEPAVSGLFSMSLSSLVDHIIKDYHEYVRSNTPIIRSLLAKVEMRHGSRYPFISQSIPVFEELATDLEAHMNKEEEIVFPMIKDIEAGKLNVYSANLAYAINKMEQEHQEAGDRLADLNKFTNNYEIPIGACTTLGVLINLMRDFEINLHEHVYVENHVLFPAAVR